MTREPTEMELRVAEALFAEAVKGLSAHHQGPCIRETLVDEWVPRARAAIRAMRPLSLAHMDASGVNPLNPSAGCTVTDIWERLIDTASPPERG